MTANESENDPDYYAPETVEQAREHLTKPGARVIAGGQTLALLWQQGFVDADVLVDVSHIPALSSVSIADGRATVGATTTYVELATHALADRVAMLGDACGNVADRQVKNAGTIGGAVAHADPSFDILPPLLCLEADVKIGSVGGSRTVPLSEFFVGHMETALGEDELIEALAFDLPEGDRTGTAYEKHTVVENGWATVGAAALVELEGDTFVDVRVALASVAETAIRSRAVEDALLGETVTPDAIAEASEAVGPEIDPLDDLAGSAEYKRSLAPRLVEESLTTALTRARGDG